MPNDQPQSFSPSALHVPGRNRLLELLPEETRERIRARMRHVRLEHGKVLFEPGEPVTHATFPLSGVVSVVVELEKGGVVEVGTVGNEGMAGLTIFLGSEMTRRKAFMQVEGEGLMLPADALREETANGGPLDDILRRYALGYLHQVGQTAACNRAHDVEQRLCRWILMCHDKISSNTLDLTQQFLAEMLGVRRASVTVAASRLQKAGLIRYRRGQIEVLDRARLESTACECYRSVRTSYEKLLA